MKHQPPPPVQPDQRRAGRFKPVALTAAAVAAFGLTVGAALAASGFVDVADNHRASAEITAAHQVGVFQGYGDGTFRPDLKLTRGQAELVIRRMLTWQGTDDDGNFEISRADAAVLAMSGLCGLDPDRIPACAAVGAAEVQAAYDRGYDNGFDDGLDATTPTGSTPTEPPTGSTPTGSTTPLFRPSEPPTQMDLCYEMVLRQPAEDIVLRRLNHAYSGWHDGHWRLPKLSEWIEPQWVEVNHGTVRQPYQGFNWQEWHPIHDPGPTKAVEDDEFSCVVREMNVGIDPAWSRAKFRTHCRIGRAVFRHEISYDHQTYLTGLDASDNVQLALTGTAPTYDLWPVYNPRKCIEILKNTPHHQRRDGLSFASGSIRVLSFAPTPWPSP